MNIRIILSVFTGLLLYTLTSCNPAPDSKESYLKNYSSFIDEITKKKDSYNEEDWKKKDEEFKKYSTELYEKYKNDLGWTEQIKIGKYAITYGVARGAKALNNALENGELEDAVGEISNIFNEDVKKDLDSVIKNFKNVWDEDLKDELSEKLDELKNKLEDEEFKEELTNKLDEIKDILNDKELEGKLKDAVTELQDVFEELEKEANKK